MSEIDSFIYDKLAAVTAEMDQLQAHIDESRSLYPYDQEHQLNMDRMQLELNERRQRAKIMKEIADIVYGK